jgi:hypothetical protein
MKKILAYCLVFGLYVASAHSVFATEANIKCSPATGNFKVGDTFTVDYILDTRNFQTFGSDIQVNYDYSIIGAQSSQSTPVTTTTGWSAPVTNTVDGTTGKIHLDYGNAQPAFTGNGSVGQITFKALAAGQAQFNYVFFQQYDNTTPGVSKVWGKKDNVNLSNILTEVTNCIYVVEAASAPTSAPVPTTPPLPTALPEAGISATTSGLIGLAGIFMILGVTVPLLFIKARP